MTDFTPWSGLAGGILIGFSAVLLMIGYGRIAGASGIFAGLLTLEFGKEFAWCLTFMAGLLAGALIVARLMPIDVVFPANLSLVALSGLIVGVGTALGYGCTSGHGICGLSRLSPRSLAATLTFMAVAIVTVFVMRHVVGT